MEDPLAVRRQRDHGSTRSSAPATSSSQSKASGEWVASLRYDSAMCSDPL